MIGTVGEGLFELGLDEGDVDGATRRGYGGDAANTAVMAARLGVGARLCSRVGADALGRLLHAFWGESGVDVRWVGVDDDAPTGLYVNERLVSGGARMHYHRRGSAGSRLTTADVPDEFLDGLGVLHYTGVTLAISESAAEAAEEAARRARRLGALVSFAVNHRPALGADESRLADSARGADVVFVSVEEAPAIFGADRPADVVAAVGQGPRELVVTLGANGATVFAGDLVTSVAAPPTELVDATGAGDALAGAYLALRHHGHDPAVALGRAVAAASLSCAAPGCALSYPDAASVEALFVAT